MLKIKFFASCADEAGTREKEVAFYPSAQELVASVPELAFLKNHPQIRVVVNHEWADWDTPLKKGDEIAFLPPVSGG